MGTNVWLPERHKFSRSWMWNLQGLLQSLSLGKILIDSVVPYYPQENIVCGHSCDECKRSNELNVCHKLLSISWPLVPVCSRTKECQVYQSVPDTSISRRSVSILLTVLQTFPTPWNYGRPSKELRLCTTAPSFICQVFQRTFSRDLPCQMTKRLFSREISSIRELFWVAPAEIRDSNISLNLSIILSFTLKTGSVHPKYTWPNNDFGSPRSNSFINLSTWYSNSVFFQPYWCRPRIPTKTRFVFDEQRDIPSLVLFPIPVHIELSSTCLSPKRPASGWPYTFRSMATCVKTL